MNEFLSAAEFNKVADIEATNCFAFALGLTESNGVYELPRKDCDGCKLDIAEAFRRISAYHGFCMKRVSNLEETNGVTAFVLWGWFAGSDFHVARKNPNGMFEHKPDFHKPATETTLDEIRVEYPESYKVFVLDM